MLAFLLAFGTFTSVTAKELADASEFRITDKSENHRFGEGILQVFGPEKLTGKTYRENKEIKSVYIGGKVTSIIGHCFDGCSNLSRIELSDSVTEIRNNAFEEDKIARIGIPGTVTFIHNNAFGFFDIPKKFVIYCEKDSYAENFAKKYNIKYEYATMIYCVDGRTMMVTDEEKSAYLESDMWNTTPLIKLYKAKGETEIVHRDEVEKYVKLGWYEDKFDITVTMYAEDGSTKEVFRGKISEETRHGWHLNKSDACITMYALDGRTKEVFKGKVEDYKKVGWYDNPIITVYAMDGRTKKIASSKLDAYKKVGWYDSPIITMYAEDGRTKRIASSKKTAYEKVGWYDGPVITMYAPDGRAMKISSNDKKAYENVGWYDVPMAIVGALDGRNKVIKKTDLDAYKKVGWYHIPNVNLKTVDTVEVDDFLYTSEFLVENHSFLSSVHQFKYKDEGFAYAYKEKNKVIVKLPSKELIIDAKYPSLGDVISDDDGNIYMVYGKANEDIKKIEELTMFISKYTPDGEHIKTTSFRGAGGWSYTYWPFWFGNCDSAIGNGKLMVNYARRMYNGHQSNNVIGVNIDDMSPVTFTSGSLYPYTSHSFNQRVIFSKHTGDFIYADHGDAYDRGFIITTDKQVYNIFHFYLQSKANNDMSIVNKTFAQMGSLLETDESVALVGASVKSISEKANEERQNLFIQIFNPNADKVDEKMFVGGVKRKGATSFDGSDSVGKPLEEVTDYGVQWLTDYTDGDVITPNAVVADDKIVILWNKRSDNHENYRDTEAFYTILAHDGKVIVPPTSLGENVVLNVHEDPVYHNGKIYWAGVYLMNLTVMSIDVPK